MQDFLTEIERAQFIEHLEQCSKVVETWPFWKQRLLGGVGVPTLDCNDCKEKAPFDTGNF